MRSRRRRCGCCTKAAKEWSERFPWTGPRGNTPIRQVWISAQATSYKLDFDELTGNFTLPKTGEALKLLTQRLLREHLQDPTIVLP